MTDPDGYTGQVFPGGDGQRRTAGSLEITKLAVDPQMSNNCYLLRCVDTGD
jgi:glyoxylase-like metal-dependent hydrolase (beta-lactamase superfamily II)